MKKEKKEKDQVSFSPKLLLKLSKKEVQEICDLSLKVPGKKVISITPVESAIEVSELSYLKVMFLKNEGVRFYPFHMENINLGYGQISTDNYINCMSFKFGTSYVNSYIKYHFDNDITAMEKEISKKKRRRSEVRKKMLDFLYENIEVSSLQESSVDNSEVLAFAKKINAAADKNNAFYNALDIEAYIIGKADKLKNQVNVYDLCKIIYVLQMKFINYYAKPLCAVDFVAEEWGVGIREIYNRYTKDGYSYRKLRYSNSFPMISYDEAKEFISEDHKSVIDNILEYFLSLGCEETPAEIALIKQKPYLDAFATKKSNCSFARINNIDLVSYALQYDIIPGIKFPDETSYVWKDLVCINGSVTAEEFPISGKTDGEKDDYYQIDDFLEAVAKKYNVDVDDVATHIMDNFQCDNYDVKSLPFGIEDCGCYINGIPEWF